MSKYDFEIDLSPGSSTGMIMSKLRPGSMILEFGCATGRMTRYMKESLGCRVYIVEYNEAAFLKASQFAEDGICDDIQNYRWVEQFGGIAFDAIIFADVIEHLSQPEETLKKAASLLKDDGCIYISVPNVTHNDIVLKMYEERFDYTQTGLLDDTHIHFWGLENIKQLGAVAGLTATCVEGTYCSAGSTEQNIQLGKHRLLENILRERQAGEVYQFVVTLEKNRSRELMCKIDAPTVMSHIYLDRGKDFNPEERVAVASYYSGKGSYLTYFVMETAEKIHRIRLDPVEFQSVILRSVSICQNGEALPVVMPNGVQTADGVLLTGVDPMVYAQVRSDQGPITVNAEFILPGADYLRILEKTVCTNQATQPECVQHDSAESSQLAADVGAYIVLTNQKEKITIELERQCGEYAALVDEKEKIIRDTEQRCAEYADLAENRGRYIFELEKGLEYYQNLPIIKVRALAGRILRKIKRCVMKLLGRG